MAIAETIGIAISVVKAAPEVISAVEGALEAFERSCVIEVVNMSPESMEPVGQAHESGAFGQAPARIDAFTAGLMSSHSTDFAQGAVGRATFQGRDVTLTIHFSNPFVGDNHAEVEVSGPRAGEFEVASSAGGGNQGARFRYVLTHPVQNNWRFCGRCHGLYWNGPDQVNHRCFSGEVHLPLGLEFIPLHSIPEGPRVQAAWGFCPRCHGMFFTGGERASQRCPAGGLHDAVGLGFALPHDLPANAALQTGWRFCGRCHGMFFNGPDRQNHRCADGGLHDPAGFEFALPHT